MLRKQFFFSSEQKNINRKSIIDSVTGNNNSYIEENIKWSRRRANRRKKTTNNENNNEISERLSLRSWKNMHFWWGSPSCFFHPGEMNFLLRFACDVDGWFYSKFLSGSVIFLSPKNRISLGFTLYICLMLMLTKCGFVDFFTARLMKVDVELNEEREKTSFSGLFAECTFYGSVFFDVKLFFHLECWLMWVRKESIKNLNIFISNNALNNMIQKYFLAAFMASRWDSENANFLLFFFSWCD